MKEHDNSSFHLALVITIPQQMIIVQSVMEKSQFPPTENSCQFPNKVPIVT